MMYTRVGEVPPKRHTQFRQPDGSLYTEELIGRDGFSQDSALLYHQRSPTELLTIESRGHVRAPGRYLSDRGQFLETSPYCERDVHPPTQPLVVDDTGQTPVVTKRDGRYTNHIMASHPFDVVGWDGCLYPYKLSIHDFEPLTGRIHQPPPVHQTFESAGFVVCSFVPRKIDYHPLAIPAPYTHSNVDSDEVLVYFEGDFLSRRGVEIRNGSVTLHPAGMTHGPQPGAVEASLGSESTNEIAVMIDTFAPLRVAESALEFGDKTYAESWTTRPTTEGPP